MSFLKDSISLSYCWLVEVAIQVIFDAKDKDCSLHRVNSILRSSNHWQYDLTCLQDGACEASLTSFASHAAPTQSCSRIARLADQITPKHRKPAASWICQEARLPLLKHVLRSYSTERSSLPFLQTPIQHLSTKSDKMVEMIGCCLTLHGHFVCFDMAPWHS